MPATAAEGAIISKDDASDISSDEGQNARSVGDEWSPDGDEEASREYMTFVNHEGHTDASEYEEEEHFGTEMRDETMVICQTIPRFPANLLDDWADQDVSFVNYRHITILHQTRTMRFWHRDITWTRRKGDYWYE